MARPGTVYIDDHSRVRTEQPGPGSSRSRPCYPTVLLSSNSGLLESSKKDKLRLFHLLGW